MYKRWHVGVLGLGRLPIGWRLVIAFGGINLLVFTMMAVTVFSLGQAEQALARPIPLAAPAVSLPPLPQGWCLRRHWPRSRWPRGRIRR